MIRTAYSLALTFSLLACTTSESPDDTVDSPDDDVTTTEDVTPDPDSGIPSLDPEDCDAFAANAVDAQNACGSDIPAGGEAALAQACRKGLESASLCGGDPGAGLDCFRSTDPTDWVCYAGEVLPSCNNDIEAALGMYCLVKLGDPKCASISCENSLDCPTGYSCNDATGQCFSQSANCVGLPCENSLDCPTGEVCNDAEHACIKG